MPKRVTTEEFVRRAKLVHGNKYDYSCTQYVNMHVKVSIICSIHGQFVQAPQPHLQGQGCPVCGKEKYRESMLARYGVDNAMKVKSFQKKARKTCLERYGSEWAMSNESIKNKVKQTNNIRYGVDRPLQNKDILEKAVCTVRDRYGKDNPSQVPVFRDKMHQTCLLRYGTKEPLQSVEIRSCIKATNQRVYGGNAPLSSVVVRQRCEETVLRKYGVRHICQSEVIIEKIKSTKAKNHTFSVSQSENDLYVMLCSIFGKHDVFRHYITTEYPFACDFYILSRDMYIELNAHWTHGKHWFNEQSNDDMFIVQSWMQKNTTYYKNAIHVWTKADVKKRMKACENNLNYVVFWNTSLEDAKLWVSLNCPDGHDYVKEYSWIS